MVHVDSPVAPHESPYSPPKAERSPRNALGFSVVAYLVGWATPLVSQHYFLPDFLDFSIASIPSMCLAVIAPPLFFPLLTLLFGRRYFRTTLIWSLLILGCIYFAFGVYNTLLHAQLLP